MARQKKQVVLKKPNVRSGVLNPKMVRSLQQISPIHLSQRGRNW